MSEGLKATTAPVTIDFPRPWGFESDRSSLSTALCQSHPGQIDQRDLSIPDVGDGIKKMEFPYKDKPPCL